MATSRGNEIFKVSGRSITRLDQLSNEEVRERLGQKAMLSICMVQRRQGR